MRPLGYRLRQQEKLVTTNAPSPNWDGGNWPTTDPDQKVIIPITVSLNDIVALASAIDVGSDIAYGDAPLLQNIWMSVFMPETLCDAIASCLTDPTSSAYSALQELVEGTAESIIGNNRYSQQQLSSEQASGNCTDDAKFGRIVALIEYIDQVQLDFYESVDAATNVVAQAAQVVSAVPVFETLPFDEIIQFVADVGEELQDSYEASVNTQLTEDFACQLWCAYGDQCAVTVADVRQLLLERYNVVSTTGQLNAISAVALLGRMALTVAQAGGLTYIGDDFVYLSWLVQLSAIELTGTFFGVDPIDYVSTSETGTPNNAWSLCSCVSTPCTGYDFINGQQGWFPVAPGSPLPSSNTRATWSGTAWERGLGNGLDEIAVGRLSPIPVTRSVQVYYEGLDRNCELQAGDENNPGTREGNFTGSGTYTISGLNITGTYVRIRLSAINQNAVPLAGRITRIELCDA